MLRYILFDCDLFSDPSSNQDESLDAYANRQGLLWILEALTQWNQIYLRLHPDTPKLYSSGVRYGLPAQFEKGEVAELVPIVNALKTANLHKDRDVARALNTIRDMIGGERFRDVARVLEAGICDCDNLAAFRCAELRNAGIQAMPYITHRRRPDGGMTYHAVVQWVEDAQKGDPECYEDPSRLLGMGGEAYAKERQDEVRKLTERLARRMAKAEVAKAAIVGRSTGKGKTAVGIDYSNQGTGTGFGQGIYYQPSFWTDDRYEDFHPSDPVHFEADPHFNPAQLYTPTPLQMPPNALWRGSRDEEWRGRFHRDDADDDMWGDAPRLVGKKVR